MRMLKAAAFVAALSIVPLGAYAQSTPTAKKAAPAAQSSVATHTTAGTVKSSTDSALVITKGGKDQTFTLNGSTEKTGAIETGAHVTVHYTMDGKTMVATAVAVQPAKGTPKGKK
jgi:hypothetical protein